MSKKGINMKYKTIDDVNKAKPKESLLTALSFGQVIKYGETERRTVLCICGCGGTGRFTIFNIVNGYSKSCGCVNRNRIIAKNTKYVGSNKKINDAYGRMMRRCYNEKDVAFHDYGARGVVVCDEWINSKQSFIDWAINNGWEPGLELDKDIKGNGLLYSPTTCCWTTRAENQKHKRSLVKYSFENEQLSLREISNRVNISYIKMCNRVYNGKKTIIEAIEMGI